MNVEDAMLRLQPRDETAAEFYALRPPHAPWGDYGDVLLHGITASDARNPSPCALTRAGPYVPPITMPGLGLPVLTDAARIEFERSGLSGFSFAPVTKEVIVPLDWQEWDLLAEEPPVYPEDGEPESYLPPELHSPELARRMPELWALVTSEGVRESRVQTGSSLADLEIRLRKESWRGLDFFRGDTTLRLYVTARACLWLLGHFAAWVTFEAVGLE